MTPKIITPGTYPECAGLVGVGSGHPRPVFGGTQRIRSIPVGDSHANPAP